MYFVLFTMKIHVGSIKQTLHRKEIIKSENSPDPYEPEPNQPTMYFVLFTMKIHAGSIKHTLHRKKNLRV